MLFQERKCQTFVRIFIILSSSSKSAGMNCFKYLFFVRIIKAWNNLPNNILFDGEISVKSFKSRLTRARARLTISLTISNISNLLVGVF